jgi:hypothetical protein
MNTPKAVGECAFCGHVKQITHDHIPPRNLFPKPRSANLITVPCCEECRTGWSDDDEYFRLHAISARCAASQSAQEIVKKIEDSLEKPRKRGYRKMIRDGLCEVPIYSKGGIYLGHSSALKVDDKRIRRVMRRIIRGLYYHEHGASLPSTHEVKGYVCESDFPVPLLNLLESINYEGFCPIRSIQDDVFKYTFHPSEEDKNSTLWIGWFYENIGFFGVTRCRNKV